jgi:tetratricopeptide (TPR) repeat protein
MNIYKLTAIFLTICVLSGLCPGQRAKKDSPAKAKPEVVTPQMKHFRQIDDYLKEGKPADALAEVATMLEAFPIDLEVHTKAYEIYTALGKKDEAAAVFAAMLERFDSNADVQYKAYELALAGGDMAQADARLTKSLALTSDETVKSFRQEKLADLTKRREEAARLKAEAEEKAARLAIIDRRIVDGTPNEAVEDLNKLIDKFPADADLRFEAHEVFAALERFDDAERRLNESIEMTKNLELKNQRKLKAVDLNYKRELAAERKRKEEIALAFKKINLFVGDGKVAEALAGLDKLVKDYPKDSDVRYSAYEVLVATGDYVTAEAQLNKAVELCTDTNVKHERELKFVELNFTREKLLDELVASVSKSISEVDFAAALKSLEGMDKISLYHQGGYIARAGILGVSRQYPEAVNVYKRVLEDPKVTQETRQRIDRLREYCAGKMAAAAPAQAAGRCHFCAAPVGPKEAYCHVCLMFQHPIATVSTKNAVTTFTWDGPRLSGVSYDFKQTHKAHNFFSTFGAAVAAASAQGASVDYTLHSAETVNRKFDFLYNQGQPAGISFSSAADGGNIETYRAVAYGAGASDVSKVDETGAKTGGFSFDDSFVYPNFPAMDPAFATMAFRRNIHRGFASNFAFIPGLWSEPHLYVLYYDDDSRVTKAVDSYVYDEAQSAAQHFVIKERKPFIGPNAVDPLQDAVITIIVYNDQGLVATLKRLQNDKEFYRREIVYGPDGILGEREYYGAQLAAEWKYKWKQGKLLECSVEGKVKDYHGMKLMFRQ